MTVSSETSKISYAGNGSTTAFAIPFYFLADADIRAILVDDTTGAETVWVLTTDYTLVGAGNPAGGTLTAVVAPASGETLVIKRALALTQETDYVENDEFPAAAHEEALDRLTMISQQQQEEIERAILAPEGDAGDVDYTLPAAEATKLMRWNEAGDALENINVEDLGAVSISDFGKSLVDDADAAEARATLELDTNLIATTITHNMATDADYTLTAAQNKSGRIIITDTGVVLTTSRNIVVSDAERLIYAKNETLQDLTFKTLAGAGVLVKPGENRSLICDGVNILNQLPSGSIIQVVNVTDGAVATGTTTMPFDDTIPQNTEGDEYMTLSITPTKATNKLLITSDVHGAHTATTQTMMIALFQDAIANALAVSYGDRNNVANATSSAELSHYMTAGTTSAITFKIRMGFSAAGTTTFNGQSSSRLFGGAMASHITIMEIEA